MKFPAPRSIDTPQVQVHYFDLGNPAGTPVLLLHGFPDSPIAWGPVIDRLDTSNLRLIVPYLRGYGPTTVLRDDLVGGQEAALGHDLLVFTNALGLERFHLVGHDWGARTAYAACIFAPDRILSLLTLRHVRRKGLSACAGQRQLVSSGTSLGWKISTRETRSARAGGRRLRRFPSELRRPQKARADYTIHCSLPIFGCHPERSEGSPHLFLQL
jgi:pimeloyl-ACP methyl ester carboxylesterase